MTDPYPQDAPPTQPLGNRQTTWPTWVPSASTAPMTTAPMTTAPMTTAPMTTAPATSVSQPAAGPAPVAHTDGAEGTEPTEWAPTPVPPAAPKVTHLPAPTGPNWGLVMFGLVFIAVAVGVVANQTSGFRVSDLTTFGPAVLVGGGLVCALVGLAGILRRRRH